MSDLTGSETKLAREVERLSKLSQLVFDHAPAMMFRVDPEGRILQVNRSAEATLSDGGIPRTLGLLAGQVFRCVNALQEPGCGRGEPCKTCQLRGTIERSFESREAIHRTPALLTVETEEGLTGMKLLVTVVPIETEGTPEALVSVENTTLHERLHESEQRYRTLFERMQTAFALHEIILDEAGTPTDYRFLEVNAAFEKMTGLERAKVLGRTVREVLPGTESDPADWIRRYGEVALTGEEVQFEQFSVALGRWFSVVGYSPFEGQFATLFVDTSERKEMEARLAQSDRLASMGVLAAGVAHEINNPLSYILFNLESIAEELPGLRDELRLQSKRLSELESQHGPAIAGERSLSPLARMEELQTRLEEALAGTRRIREVTRGLSTFSRIESEPVALVELAEVLDSVSRMAANEVKFRARLVKDYQPGPKILAGEARLSQVFLNLIVNAAHAIEEGHPEENEIRLSLRTEGMTLVAKVSDTGAGIEPGHLAHLFDPFFTTKKTGEGSGLGLSISRNLVKSFGGTIEVESELGRGSSFTLRLPIPGPGPETAAPGPRTKPESSSPVAGRILVVDDEEAVRRAIARMLRGHEVVQAGGGEEAKALIEANPAFDLILCDMMMPGLSGMDLHRWLVEAHPRLADRLVFATGGAFTPRAREYLRSTSVPTLEKPFDLPVFRKRVAELLRASTRTSADEDPLP